MLKVQPAEEQDRTGKGGFSFRFTLPLYLGSTLNPINSSLIATALVPIATALHVPVGSVSALVAAVYLTSAVAQPAAGKLAEVFGPRRVFLIGTVAILAAGVVGTFGRDLGTLITARVLIGLGSSTAYPSAIVLVRRRAEAAGMKEPPGSVLGGLAVAGMAVAAVGLPLGGLLIGATGWRTVFLVNIPVALLTFVVALMWLPADKRPEHRSGVTSVIMRIDLAGMLLFGCATTALLVFLLALPHTPWAAAVLAAASFTALIVWELRSATPFIDLRLLARNGPLRRTYVRVGLTSLVMYGVMYGVSQWLEPGRHLPPAQVGLLLLPMSAIAPIVSFPVSQKNLVRGPLLITAFSLVGGSLGVLLMNAQTPLPAIGAIMLVFGLSMGLFSVSNQTALYTQAPNEAIGTAAGLFRTFAYLGSIGSSAVTGIVFRYNVTDRGLHAMAVTFIAAGLIVLIMTLLDTKLPRRQGDGSRDRRAQE